MYGAVTVIGFNVTCGNRLVTRLFVTVSSSVGMPYQRGSAAAGVIGSPIDGAKRGWDRTTSHNG